MQIYRTQIALNRTTMVECCCHVATSMQLRCACDCAVALRRCDERTNTVRFCCDSAAMTLRQFYQRTVFLLRRKFVMKHVPRDNSVNFTIGIR